MRVYLIIAGKVRVLQLSPFRYIDIALRLQISLWSLVLKIYTLSPVFFASLSRAGGV